MSSHVAQIFEHSSRINPEEEADPLMLLYRSLDVHTPDIARVVLAIHDLRMIANNMDERLRPLLLQDVHGYDLAIASLLSVHGKGLKYLTTETKSYTFVESQGKKKISMREVFAGEQRKPQDPGVPVPDFE